jgi:hypothetical protein
MEFFMSNPLLELMRQGESGAAGYNAYNRGTYVGSDGKEHIRGADRAIDFSQLTLGQVQDLQHLGRRDPDRLFAVGKYQIIPTTMDGGARTLGLDRDQRFTPELQDRIFSEYLIVGKRPAVHDYIVGKEGASLHDAQKALAMEWASFGDPDKGGRSYYGGANRASITLAQSSEALTQMRAEYQASIGKGMSPQDAWKMATSASPEGQRQSTTPQSRAVDADGIYRQGERGEGVRHLQEQLNQLGYRDAQGRPLSPDGDFGDRTRQALLAFQQTYGLKADGIAGPQTLEALKKAEQEPLLSNPNHRDHALYKQSYDELKKLDPATLGFSSDRDYQNAAASIAFEARVSGIKQVDHVLPSANGAGLIVVQGDLNDPAHSRLYVDKAQAAAQPLEQSTGQLQQEMQRQPQPSQQQQFDQQQREQARVMLA